LSFWKKAATCAATALAGLVLGTAPAAAATYPTSNIGPAYKGPSYGATWARGTITWYNRSVGIDGELRTVSSSDCRRLYAITQNSLGATMAVRSTSLKCGVAVHDVPMTVPADGSGGAAFVQFCLDDDNGDDFYLTCSERYPRP
jgi:hypothetical protein